LGSLDLLLKDVLLSFLGIFDLLLELHLQVHFGKSLLFSGSSNCAQDFLRMSLGSLDGVIGKLLLLLLSLFEGRCDFEHGELCLFSIHSHLRCLVELLGLLLRLLNDGADELGSLLDSDLHPLIEDSSDLFRLLFIFVRSSLPCSGQSLIRDLTNFLGLLQFPQFSGLALFLLNGLESDWCDILLVE